MSKLHVFDMDGTLLDGASVEAVSRLAGCLDEATALEQAYLRGEVVDDVGWWEQVLALWVHLSDDEIDDAFARAPWIDGLDDVLEDIARRGEHSAVISQSPQFLVRLLEQRGAEFTFATRIERTIPVLQGQMLTATDKVEITIQLLADLRLDLDDCVAYGDSTSDVELFRTLGNTVGVNATDVLLPLAARVYRGHDLRDAYALGRSLLADPVPARARRPSR